MAVMTRIGRLLRGFFSLFLGKVEAENPKLVLADLRERLRSAQIKHNSTTAQIIAREKQAKVKVERARQELDTCQAQIKEAREQGNRELALQLLIQEEHLTAMLVTTEQSYAAIRSEADGARRAFAAFEAEMFQNMSRIEQMEAQADLAGLKRELNALRSEYATDDGAGKLALGLRQAEEVITGRLAKEDAISELGKNSLDAQMRDLKTAAVQRRAEEKLAALFGPAAEVGRPAAPAVSEPEELGRQVKR